MTSLKHSIPRLVLGGVASGVGKTTVTIALARALRARGLRVALFKCGPDYLDPTYHARAIDGTSHNLDGWMMGRDAVRTTFVHAARDADIALIEGVMGLFDGATATGEEGSTAEIAKWLEAPTVLVVDAGGMARSFAAVCHGFASFDAALTLRGVIANRVGSRGHLELLDKALGAPLLLGGLPRDTKHAFAERHLGLRSADESVLPDALLDHWADHAGSWLQLDTLLSLARSAPALACEDVSTTDAASRVIESGRINTRCRIGLAYDDAFHFYYADNLRRLEQLGVELVRFSPIHDAALPAVDGLYLGGGYPEAHAAQLAGNLSMHEAIRAFVEMGGPVYAECGGLMYLTQAIRSVTGERHPMVGVFPCEVQMFERLQALGYVEVETQTASMLGPVGTRFRGHQFRYSEVSPAPSPDLVEHAYKLQRRRGGDTLTEGYQLGSVLGSYVHAHWASNPQVAAALIARCKRFRSKTSEQDSDATSTGG